MIDDFVKKLTKIFEKYGDPALNPEKYNVSESELSLFNFYYSAYSSGILKQAVAAGGQIPRIKVTYNGDIDELISKINSIEDLNSKVVIYISNEINDINHLNKLKETYHDKEIVINWNNELSFIDDVISAVYMIDYYKSVIDDNLSSLEKVTMAYDIVKSHYYKEYNVKNTMKSRNITEMVNNDCIVCRGYVNIFNRLLREMGVNASFLDLSLKSDDKVVVEHSRSFVHLTDEKYGIDGYFVFDPTWDSIGKEHYYQFNEEYAKYSRVKKDDYEKADSLVSYIHFLVPLQSYEIKFSNSHDEKITLQNNTKLDSKLTHDMLHTNQNSNSQNALSPLSFVNLLYNVKLAEGYSIDDIPRLIQESLYVSKYGYYKLNSINSAINSILQNEQKERKSKGFVTITLFYLIGIIILILTFIYCILH